MREVRMIKGELTVWWPHEDQPVTNLNEYWCGPIPPSSGPGSPQSNASGRPSIRQRSVLPGERLLVGNDECNHAVPSVGDTLQQWPRDRQR